MWKWNKKKTEEDVEAVTEEVAAAVEETTDEAPVEEPAEETSDEAVEESAEETEETAPKKGMFAKLKEGLTKTRKNIVYGIDTVFGAYDDLDDEFFEDLEEQLIIADVGVHTSEEVLDELREMVKDERIHSTEDCRAALSRLVASKMSVPADAYDFEDGPSVVLVIGVNGVGKTTYCGKMASALKQKGKKVILAAADTFRAAATEQLMMWGERAGVDVISGQEGSDPASVIYDALHAAKARHADILICDTAGRLNNKKNLMNELDKIDRIITRELPEYKRENLIVLDATTGQNAMSQAKDFSEVSDITGIVLTKMDGTAKGGIAIAIASELSVPVKFIGVGEGIDDVLRFDPEDFAKAMFEGASDEQI